MSLSNRIENTIIAILTVIITVTATVLIINFTSIKPLQKQLTQQNALIKELAELEKYQIQNNFDKLKSHKGQIVLDLNNDMAVSNAHENINLSSDSTVISETPELKKSFWEKLIFWK
jgi:predicted Holliday junction resolvase-like endonuclease